MTVTFAVSGAGTGNSGSFSEYENSLQRIENAMVEPSLADAVPGDKFQFVRFGYFCKDTNYENTFNQVVSLKDAFVKK